MASADNYHRWLTDLALPFLGDDPLELGSGLGDYARRWLEAGVPRMTLTEIDPSRASYLRERFGDDDRVSILDLDILDPPEGGYSSLVAFNVLEHIPDPVRALRESHKLLRPGAAVVMFVPAFPFALGAFDRAVGHLRRYTRATLRQTYEDAGIGVEILHYVNAPGLIAWTIVVRLLGMTPGDGPGLRLWDGTVIRAARRVEARIRPPFGQSLFAVGRVTQ